MKTNKPIPLMNRRKFLRWTGRGILFSAFSHLVPRLKAGPAFLNDIFWIKDIPEYPFEPILGNNFHSGIGCLLSLMGSRGLKFYRSERHSVLSGPEGMISPEDVVLIKVNAQWKYRGCTNVDLVRGLIQSILDHPDGFTGEVVLIENGQGRGSFYCDRQFNNRMEAIYPDDSVHANAENEGHHYMYLVDEVFNDIRVSAYLFDSIREIFIGEYDHQTDGYRIYENVSYPCFTTAGGRRVELREGIWNGTAYEDKIKLINVPVFKMHDRGGSEITAALKHFYGIVSMADGQIKYRHFSGLGETSGKMIASVRTPILNIIDAIWVSHQALQGYPPKNTIRINQILAGQDPVALDYWAAKHIMYPIKSNPRHHPEFPGIDFWLTQARDAINLRGGLYKPNSGIFIDKTTKNEQEMKVHDYNARRFIEEQMGRIFQRGQGKRRNIIK